MNKNLLIIIAIAILLLGGGWYFLSTRKETGSNLLYKVPSQNQGALSSLKDLIAKNIAQSCTFKNNEGGTESSGTVYVSGGKVRGDFDVTTTDGKQTKSHMIVMDSTTYIWNDGDSTGFKTTMDTTKPEATTSSGTSSTENTQGSFDANANMNYSCSAWTVDSSKFELPKGVNFQSFGGTVQPQGNTSPSSSSQCSYCDSLTGDQLTQCKAALNCK